MLTAGSLFSGMGGLDLGLERAGMTVKWQCEIDDYCSRVLAKHWPNVPNLGDVTKVDWEHVERVDLVCGGYPCQPFSQAGAQRGSDDAQYLWPYFADCLRVLRPRYALLENVVGHFRVGFDAVLADLAALGFDADWSVVSACSVGAPHTRERLFVLAYATGDDGAGEGARHPGARPVRGMEHRRSSSPPRSEWWLSEPRMGRVAHGVPRRLVNPPLRAVGNAVVPQVAEFIGRQLLEAVGC